uniref:Uncharacterized protein n=1 Tax=Cacopsylla melanoneura TaxID=428564 RepID=A0A8D8XIJ7_9HEMI
MYTVTSFFFVKICIALCKHFHSPSQLGPNSSVDKLLYQRTLLALVFNISSNTATISSNKTLFRMYFFFATDDDDDDDGDFVLLILWTGRFPSTHRNTETFLSPMFNFSIIFSIIRKLSARRHMSGPTVPSSSIPAIALDSSPSSSSSWVRSINLCATKLLIVCLDTMDSSCSTR